MDRILLVVKTAAPTFHTSEAHKRRLWANVECSSSDLTGFIWMAPSLRKSWLMLGSPLSKSFGENAKQNVFEKSAQRRNFGLSLCHQFGSRSVWRGFTEINHLKGCSPFIHLNKQQRNNQNVHNGFIVFIASYMDPFSPIKSLSAPWKPQRQLWSDRRKTNKSGRKRPTAS